MQRKSLKKKIEQIYELKLKDDAIDELTEKFEQHSTERYGIKVQEEADFKEMTGALGNFFIGQRMFAVALRLSREMEQKAIDLSEEES